MVLLTPALLLLCAPAQATRPIPDAPMATASGYLVAPRSLELEVGGHWQQGYTVPTRVKLGVARAFEPRLAFDLSGVDAGSPDLVAEGKIGFLQEENIGLGLLAASAFPIAEHERWHGTLRGLLTLPFDALVLRTNIGVDLRYDGEHLAFGGVPALAAVEVPFTSSIGAYGEAGTILGAGWDQALLDGGLLWRITEIVVADVAVGWNIAEGSPFAHLGLCANLGRLGG
jgi:hypothetical protein